MKRNIVSLISGVVLLLVGTISLMSNILLKNESWRVWPIVALLVGLGLTTPALFSSKNRGLGAFYIPGLPVLAAGGILVYALVFNSWSIWAVVWPLIVIALGFGFALSSIAMRVSGLAIPAVIILVNGLVLGFCTMTGMWKVWAVVWPIEPLSVGIGLLILAAFNKSKGTRQAGVILSIIAGGGFFIASTINIFNETVLRFLGPGMLLLTGSILLLTFFIRNEEQGLEQPTTTQVE